MNNRNRSDGWKYAKISGHENEDKIEELLLNNINFKTAFLKAVHKENTNIKSVFGGGLSEKNIECIFNNEKTKSKTDIYVEFEDNSTLNISIKKSLSGQVFLIGIERFINGFEYQYKKFIPENVKKAIRLFWGNDTNIDNILLNYYYDKSYETRKHRLTAYTLHQYDSSLYDALLFWFKENIYYITDFCFSKGLAKNKSDWSDCIWYINEISDLELNNLYYITDICKKTVDFANTKIFYGTTNGGTTIQLPFGFVQWHSPRKIIPGSIQFHHKYSLISDLNNANS